MANGTFTSEPPALVYGWQQSPNGRGTWDILWICISTTFLCAWSNLCPNIPGREEPRYWRMFRKATIAVFTTLGPEFVMGAAVMQWVSVKRSVKEFHDAGFTKWDMEHGFYAEMGGFLLKTKGCKKEDMFPIEGPKLLWLVKHGFVALPKIKKEHIKDRNKQDTLLRLITFVQVVSFLVNSCVRAACKYYVTCIEITTIGMLPCSLCTWFAWRKKPADVEMASIVSSPYTIADIVAYGDQLARKEEERCRSQGLPLPPRDYGGPGLQYHLTPLDFIDRREWEGSRLWTHYTHIVSHAGIKLLVEKKYPVTRIRNSRLNSSLKGRGFWITFSISLVYVCVMFTPWNYEFPSMAENRLWRVNVVVFLCSFVIWSLWIEYGCRLFPPPTPESRAAHMAQLGIEKLIYSSEERKRLSLRQQMILFYFKARRCLENNGTLKDPSLDLNVWWLLPTYLLGFSYCTSRSILLSLDLIELRALPASAFQTVNWTSYVPHLGA